MWTIFKVFCLLQILLLFYALVFWLRGLQVPQPGIEPTPAALEGEVLMQINKIQVLYSSAYNRSLLYSNKVGQIAQDSLGLFPL